MNEGREICCTVQLTCFIKITRTNSDGNEFFIEMWCNRQRFITFSTGYLSSLQQTLSEALVADSKLQNWFKSEVINERTVHSK